MKALLFVYGTLKIPEIQKEVLGRIVKGTPDILENYKLEKIQLGENTYPLVIPLKENEVYGVVLSINESDFPALDYYESNAYKREQLQLKSGLKAWVYLENK